MSHPIHVLALYPGLLTPVFVTFSTNKGEGLVKLSHVQWRTWTWEGVARSWKNSKKASALYQSQTRTVEWLSTQHQTVLVTFLGFRKPLYSSTEKECATPPHIQVCHFMWLSFTRTSPVLVMQALGWEGLGTKLFTSSVFHWQVTWQPKHCQSVCMNICRPTAKSV